MVLLVPFVLANQSGSALLDQAFNALGGREKLARVGSVSSTVIGHVNHVEQSERPDGPYVISYFERTERLNFDEQRWYGSTARKGLIFGPKGATSAAEILEGKAADWKGRSVPNAVFPGMTDEAVIRLNLGPERVLFAAEKSRDLRLGKQLTYQGVPHEELLFTWGQTPVTILLNKTTHMPTAVEMERVESGFWGLWGDVKHRFIWGTWDLRAGGTWLPLQWTEEINGLVTSEWTVVEPEVANGNGQVAIRTIGPGAPMGFTVARYKPIKVSEGITAWQGPFNTNVIEQKDGLVILESVNTSTFASEFLNEIAKTFPGKKVKAVISTTDAWPHFGGVRTFVARKIPVYCSERNKPILTRFLAANHRTLPDELQKQPTPANLKTVSKPVTIGEGDERLVIYPIAGEASERMLMVYWPAKKLLYGSDLLQPMPQGFFTPGYPKELAQAVERNGLAVETVFAMHMPPSPWTRVTEFLKGLGG